jgi:hypothetical protein
MENQQFTHIEKQNEPKQVIQNSQNSLNEEILNLSFIPKQEEIITKKIISNNDRYSSFFSKFTE